MRYTEEEIDRFIEIVKSVDKPLPPPKSNRVTCKYCDGQDIFIQSGYYYCSNCFISLGHVLGFYDKTDFERFHFRQKSIYQRKYHYQNKIKEVMNKFNLVLSEDEQYEAYQKLMEINDEKLSKLNKKI